MFRRKNKGQEVVDALMRAEELARGGNPAAAIELCTRLKREMQDANFEGIDGDLVVAAAWKISGEAHFELGNRDNALKDLAIAEQILTRRPEHKPELAYFLHDVAVLLLRMDAPEYAYEAFERALPAATEVGGELLDEIRTALRDLREPVSELGRPRAAAQREIDRLRFRLQQPGLRDADEVRGNLAGVLIEEGDDDEFREGQHLLCEVLEKYRIQNHWSGYAAASAVAKALIRRGQGVDKCLLVELLRGTEAVSGGIAKTTVWPEIYEAAAVALFVKYCEHQSCHDRMTALVHEAIALRDLRTSATESNLARQMQPVSGDVARFVALTLAHQHNQRELFVELLESARLQVVPRRGSVATNKAETFPSALELLTSRGASTLSKPHAVAVGQRSILSEKIKMDGCFESDQVSLHAAISAVSGGSPAWWWGAQLIDNRYFWATIDPEGDIQIGWADLDEGDFEMLGGAVAGGAAAAPGGRVLLGKLSLSPEVEEAQSLAVGELLIPLPLKTSLWLEGRDHAASPFGLSLVVASNFLAHLPLCLFAARNAKGRTERLLEKAVIRCSPPAAMVNTIANSPVYVADRYPARVGCLDPDGTLAFAAAVEAGFELTLRHSGSYLLKPGHAAASASKQNLVNALNGLGRSSPCLFFYSGHSRRSMTGTDSALVLEDGALTAGEILFGSSNFGPVPMPSRVILSSCDSSGSSGEASGEWLGLGAAILINGARQVLGTAWPILDCPTTLRLEEALIEALASGADPATALREQQLLRLHNWRSCSYSSDFTTAEFPDSVELPAIWAAFQCIGVA